MTTRTAARAAFATALALTLLLAGCGSSDSEVSPAPGSGSMEPSAGSSTTPAAEGVVVDVTVAADGTVSPRGARQDVKVGEPVTLRITAQATEEIHVHSDPERTYDVAAGDDVEKTFTIDTPGQVAVEAHGADATIVQLVVRP